MPDLDLIYAEDCPNVARARTNLGKALEEVGWARRWTEHLVGSPNLPMYARGYGSPTILVGGKDVAGRVPTGKASCRLYAGAEGLVGAPGVAQIVAAIRSRSMPLEKGRHES